jgi:hypothetical protein
MREPFGKLDRGKTYISDKLSSLYKQHNLSQGELSGNHFLNINGVYLKNGSVSCSDAGNIGKSIYPRWVLAWAIKKHHYMEG